VIGGTVVRERKREGKTKNGKGREAKTAAALQVAGKPPTESGRDPSHESLL